MTLDVDMGLDSVSREDNTFSSAFVAAISTSISNASFLAFIFASDLAF